MSESDPDVRAKIDARVAELRAASEAEGWEFEIVEETPTFVTYETRPSKGKAWRRVGVSVGDDDAVQVAEDLPESLAAYSQRRYKERKDRYKARWFARHSGRIASLDEDGHSLIFRVRHDKSFSMVIRCERCKAVGPKGRCEGERGESAAEVKLADRRSALIAALEEAGHSPTVATEWNDAGGWHTGIRCQRCGASKGFYHLAPTERLSPKRPCKGGSAE